MKFDLLRFAHAGEDHGDGLSAVSHYIAPWYIALPAFLFMMFTIGYITWLVSGKNLGTTLMVMAGAMLVSGVALYSVSPLVSAISIVGGILIAGFMALASLGSPQK